MARIVAPCPGLWAPCFDSDALDRFRVGIQSKILDESKLIAVYNSQNLDGYIAASR